MSLAIGSRLGPYEITASLGAGGMGEVYKARDTRLDRFVAIKVLPPERVEDPDRRRRFVQEAKAASALNHPNIVTVHNIDSADGVTFIVMEYVAGKTLDEVLLQRPLKLGEVLGFAIQIAGALAAAHAAGIVHRDLKPSNIMVGDDGRLRILDFGLAKLAGEPAADASAQTVSLRPVTLAGTILGTCAYMSPEQAEGRTVDARSDIFSFGVVLYEMLTRRHPFRRESMVTTMAAIVGEEPQPLSQVGAAVPPEVERAVLRCLQKEPARRWQSVSDLRSVFEDLKTESDSGWRRPAPVAPVRPSRRARWLVAGAAVVLAAAVATLMWVWAGRPAAKPESALVPLTLDAGLSAMPSVSRDGKIVAYASDRGGDGQLDIWIRHVDRPQPVRRTHDPGGALMPSVSPDGSRVVFVSGRDGGGVYVADTLGGEERKLVSRGLNPRFSPDGKWILYTRFVAGDQAETKTFVIPPDGGEPRQLHAGFVTTPDPNGVGAIWSPDSRHVLFNGERAADDTYGWWVAPIDGGAPVAVDIRVLPEGPSVRYPAAWPWDGIVVFAEGVTIEGVNLFSIGISPGPWRLTGAPKQLTSGPGLRTDVSVSLDGRLVFGIGEWTLNLFSLARDAGTGKATGDPQALTRDKRTKSGVAVSADGSRIVYGALAEVDRTQQAAVPRVELRLRDVPSGHETVLSDGRAVVKRPRISRDGSHVGYREVTPDGPAAFVWTASGGSRRVCTGCRILGFFPNADEVLVLEGPSRIVRQDLSTGNKKVVLAPSTGRVVDARLSDDGRRVAFVLDLSGGRQGLYIAPVRDAAIEARDWMSVEESETSSVGEPCWSPDGGLLYYLSDSDAHSCIWARRVDRATGRLAGASFPAFHAHSAQSSLSGGGRWNWGLNVTHDRMYLLMAEIKGNVWSTKISH